MNTNEQNERKTFMFILFFMFIRGLKIIYAGV